MLSIGSKPLAVGGPVKGMVPRINGREGKLIFCFGFSLPQRITINHPLMHTGPFSEAEITRLRAETSGSKDLIHFNNAGSSLPPDIVVETVISYLREEALCGGYETESRYAGELEHIYSQVGDLIHAGCDEVALVENASAAWGIAFQGIDLQAGDEVITSEYEYASNFIGLMQAKKTRGVTIKIIPQDEQGNFPLDKLEAAITPRTRLIAVTHIPSTAGGMLPISAIGEIARRHDILYLLDATQTTGQMPLDVQQVQCDLLAATGRKFLRAPRGTGFLYVRKQIQDRIRPLLMDGHSTAWVSDNDFRVREDARRFELYEKNRALILGLGKAIDYAQAIGMDRIWERIKGLAGLLRNKLEAIPGILVHDRGDDLCGIVTFSAPSLPSASLKSRLAEKKINVSLGVPRGTPIYMYKHDLNSIVRASLHYYNTEDELDVFCHELSAILGA